MLGWLLEYFPLVFTFHLWIMIRPTDAPNTSLGPLKRSLFKGNQSFVYNYCLYDKPSFGWSDSHKETQCHDDDYLLYKRVTSSSFSRS